MLTTESTSYHRQRRERWLLGLATLFVLVNQATLIWVQDRSWSDMWIVGVWLGCTLLLHVSLNINLPHRDPFLLPASLLLSGWGLTIIDRLQPAFADRQAIWLMVGSCALIAISLAPHDLRWLRNYRYTWLVGSLLLVLLTVFFGVHPSGNRFHPPRLWLQFWDVYYQPSELLKLTLVGFLASYLADHWLSLRFSATQRGLPASFYAPIGLMWGLSVAILLWQRDMGSATIFFMVSMLMLYIASGRLMILIVGTGLLILAGTLGYFIFDVVALRMDIWLNPWADADNTSFQLVQSLMAFSAGGIIGQGIGQGAPEFIPVVHSDFIFSAMAEEWGLIGVLSTLAIMLILVLRGLRIALVNQNRPYRALFAAGLSLMIGVQSLLIMGGTLRLWPLTGVTLPFVSYGGSSLLTSYVILGLLLVLSEGERS